MKAMILLAHGSRKKESALEIQTFASELEAQAKEKGLLDVVKPAFMQFCGPDFYEVMNEIINNYKSTENNRQFTQNSIKEIVVLPYFISAGSHVSEDIPNLIEEARIKYPEILFTVTTHLGQFQGLKRVILDEIT